MASREKFIFSFLIYLFLVLNKVVSNELTNQIDVDVLTTKAYVYWPNATIPFYIDGSHFDNEQAVKIMSAFATFAFKTCLKFAPVMARPEGTDHVLVLENPAGVRKCSINTEPHSIEEPHRVTLGYDCLKSPEIDMMIMKALGFPFEHNRAVRDLYIEVQPENIEPGYLELFTRDLRLPLELRSIPYDPNSVLHFGQREFSKNGHRTIIFKDRNLRQERIGLSPLDLRKIEVVYGPECRARDRMEKIELCQNYPGVARRKRDTEDPKGLEGVDRKKRDTAALPRADRSLRVNPDITPPPNITEMVKSTEDATAIEQAAANSYISEIEKKYDIEKEIETVIENFHKITAVALQNAKRLKCGNQTEDALRMSDPPKPRVLDAIGTVLEYVDNLVKTATQNLTEFCMEETDVARYQRSSCPFFNPDRCRKNYRSTKSGRVRHSTQHRPLIRQSTKVKIIPMKHAGFWQRSRNDSMEVTNSTTTTEMSKVERRKRDTEDLKAEEEAKSAIRRFESQRFRPKKGVREQRQQEKEWDNSAMSAENVRYHNDQRVKKIAPSKTRQVSQDNRGRGDDDWRGEEKGQRPRDERGMRGGKRPRHDDKPNRLEPRYTPDDNRNNDLKTRFHVESPDYKKIRKPKNEAAMNDENDEQRPKFMEKKPAYKQISDVVTNKNRFKVQKPAESEPIGEERNPEMEEADARDNENDGQNQHAGKVNRQKEKTITQNENGDGDNYGAGEEKKRGRGSEEDEDEAEPRDEEMPLPKKKRQKDRKYKPKVSKSKQSSHREETPSGGLPKVLKLDKKRREFYDERMWPDGVVRYVIKAPSDVDIEDVRARLDKVNQILKKKTCARLEEIPEEESDRYEDFLVLDNSPDYVTGRVGGKQPFGVVELLKGGQHRQHAAMMVMAMLGFYFEISRHDRDKYIRVHSRHIRPDKLHHFEKIREDATFPLPYDYKSATHPAWQFWRKIGKSGISTVATLKATDPDGQVMKSLGQNRQLLSDMDILKINSVYGIECFVSAPGERQGEEMEGGEEEKEEMGGEREEDTQREKEEEKGEKEQEASSEREKGPSEERPKEASGEKEEVASGEREKDASEEGDDAKQEAEEGGSDRGDE